MKCFYHGDLDGKCAGFWVKKAYNQCKMLQINYNQDFPMEDIEEGEHVFIVDFSIEPEEMKQLLDITENVVWIDHHISAIRKYKDFPYNIKGTRKNGEAGCVLTYKWLWPDEAVPLMTTYIGDWDIWAFEFGKNTEYFKMAMESYDTHPESNVWEAAILDIGKYIQEGKVIHRYKQQYYKEYIEEYGFEVEFEGNWCIACNAGKVSSKLFESVKEDYDIMMPFAYDGNQYTVSLYSDSVNCAQIAEKYGGGGHKGAAGFQCKELPFEVKEPKEKAKELHEAYTDYELVKIADELQRLMLKDL